VTASETPAHRPS